MPIRIVDVFELRIYAPILAERSAMWLESNSTVMSYSKQRYAATINFSAAVANEKYFAEFSNQRVGLT